MNTEDKVKEVLINALGGAIEGDPAIMRDLGADSLYAIEIIMDIEDAFDIMIDDSEYENVVTVSDLVKLVEGKL